MKQIITFFAGCLMITGVYAQTTYPSGVTGMIARYDFSSYGSINSLPDVSGNGNDASIVQNVSATASWRNRPGQAMAFNGASSYALIPHKAMLSPQAVTMVALIKLDNFYSGRCQFSQIVCKGYPHYISGQYAMAVGDHIFDNDCNNFDSTHQQLVGCFYNSQAMPNMKPATPGNYIAKSQWYMVAMSFNGNQLFYYQVPMDSTMHYNNVAPIYSSVNIQNSIGSNTQDISIGNHSNPSFPYWFNGKMDELVLFNKMLTQQEVQSVYDYLWGWSPTAVNEMHAQDDFKAYSLNGKLVTTFRNGHHPYTLNVYTISGQKIYQATAPLETIEIDLSAYSSQMLIITANDHKNAYVRKIAF